jgi:nitrite reductase/ring-hydroxylating ferredoxin subunit
MSDFKTVAKVSDLKPGECKTVMAGDRELALANVGGKFFACDNVCPHQGGPLGEGILDGELLVCPWHGWRFNVTTGKSPNIPVSVAAFECVVEGDEVRVKV